MKTINGFFTGYDDNQKLVDLYTGEVYQFDDFTGEISSSITLLDETYGNETLRQAARKYINTDDWELDPGLLPLFAGEHTYGKGGLILDFDGKTGIWEY